MLGAKIVSVTPVSDRPDAKLTFVAVDDEPGYRDADRQRELYGIEAALKADGRKVQSQAYIQKSGTGTSWLTGDFLLHLSALGTPVGALVGSWITARLGRKVRIKVGDIEVEAATVKEAETLIERARAIKAEQDRQP
ncbi:MAG: hypothetical protein ACRCS5_03810 [Sphingomonas sp.]|jgi:hypothetical protein|uniref:hypothetical protein n=2 Tax=Pseudomonadota TaxID=1224 RepID=UPI0026247053|nr:hypothetical protein [Sphingomonas sp. BE270]MDR7260407.1 hypothetical protein [Sphingomonas sp. BE270]|tara:strand:- start:650 stop:1060 length:411 start_codon:yes stop_codon:yes gene_type:complete